MPHSTDNTGRSQTRTNHPLVKSRKRASIAALLAGGLLSTGLLTTGLLVGAERAGAVPVPNGLPDLIVPADNPLTAEKIALGKQLYFDTRLSADNTVSCATCHDPAKGFSNGDQFATGVGGKKGGRNSPTVINAAYQAFQFWDGRAQTLEDQALGPVANPIEMNLRLPVMEKRLRAIPGYKAQFIKIFGREPVAADVAKAIAAYERTVLSGDAPYDKFVAGDTKALSEAAQRGWKLFNGKANCAACHSGPNFTDNAFHNIGIGMASDHPDTGREAISKMEGDFGSFKTPGLREIARTGPYMHDGSLKTLKDVIEHYNRGGTPNGTLDEEMFPLKLTDAEKADLVTFMEEALASPSYPNHTAPELPK
jgi:cytochrome c peroxidase